MEQTAPADWVVTRLAVARARRPADPARPGAGAGVERGHRAHAHRGRAGHRPSCSPCFETLRPADVASTLQDLPDKRRHEVADALDDERLADVLEELPEDDQVELLAHARRRAGRRRARGDGPRRRRRPARRAARRRRRAAARPDGAGGGRARCAGCCTYADDTAGGLMTPEPVDPAPRRHGRRGAGPGPQPRPHARAGRPGLRRAGRPTAPRPAATSAARTSSGCCASRRSSWSAGIVDTETGPAVARTRARRGHPLLRHLQPGRGARWSTRRTTCSARSPSTTCSTTCCPRLARTA